MPAHTQCRICRSPLPDAILDLGIMPLANAFPPTPAEFAGEPRYPLAVTACPKCGLVQLTYVVPAEKLYREYIWVSGTSEAVCHHAAALAREMVNRHGWGAGDLIVEVASNDGTVLKEFGRRGVAILGVEPARNIAAVAQAEGVPTVSEFFCEATAREIAASYGRAAAIVARHVFAHVDDVHDFLNGVDQLLRPDGILLVEVPYLGNLFQQCEFDTIYHEHLSYFSVAPLDRLFGLYGLRVLDLQWVDLQGGSMLLWVGRAEPTDAGRRLLDGIRSRDQEIGLGDSETLRRFAGEVTAWKQRFEQLIEGITAAGGRLLGYGAAAKANTLLNYCPEVAGRLAVILDRSPYKHGRYTPGTHVPVVPAERWSEVGATHMLILAWNLGEEIMRQMAPFAQAGGRFVMPIPEPVVI